MRSEYAPESRITYSNPEENDEDGQPRITPVKTHAPSSRYVQQVIPLCMVES